jgi:two-component system, OmpR family, phosphate regulon response regulator PhoB
MPKILIAEDDAALRSLIHLTLNAGQTRILEAEDGTEALEVARRESPQLIFLDWSMPGSSGIEVCRALRRQPGPDRGARGRRGRLHHEALLARPAARQSH